MDEAERCHRLAYIAYGNLLADGTVTEIIQHFGLVTWTVKGANLWQLQQQLKNLPGVEQVVRFGNLLHVNGMDLQQLQTSLLPFMADSNYQWARAESSLEDIFISLMAKSQDTSQ
jgi:ABC-2 type transport system ATP-binding protein